MRVELIEGEYKKQLGMSALGIVLANIVHMRRSMQSATGYCALYEHFLRNRLDRG